VNEPHEETLRELVGRVHERLGRASAVDADAREVLGTLMQDIQRALGARAGGGGLDRESLPRLEALAVRFEAVHPALAQVLRQLIDALGKAGI